MNASTGKSGLLRPKLRIDRDAAWTALAALLMTAGLPPVPQTWPLVPLALAVFFGRLAGSPRPARLAWLFGLVHQLTLLYWLFLLVPAKTIPTRALVPVQALAAIGYVSLFYLLLGWVYGRLRRLAGLRLAVLVLPVLWIGMEVLRGRGELAFPWCLTGSAAVGGPLLGLVRACGEIGVGAGLVFLAAALAGCGLLRRPGFGRRPAALLAGGTLLLWCGLAVGSLLRPEIPGRNDATGARREPIEVAAVQADVALADKWDDAKIDSTRIPYDRYTREAADRGAELVVWAETALPAYVRIDKPLLNWTRRLVRETGVYLYTGFPDFERRASGELLKFNSSGLFAPDGRLVDQYAKHHLLPIGEAMPFSRLIPALARIDVGQAEWSPGAMPRPLTVATAADTFSFAGLICFESIFSRLARWPVAQGAQALVVITNDGWFGYSAGPRQHAALARLRAAECGVPLIRCANNGISFVCDARGRLRDRLALGRRGVIVETITPGDGRTAYVRWGARPLGWFLAAWTVVAVVLEGLRRRRQAGAAAAEIP